MKSLNTIPKSCSIIFSLLALTLTLTLTHAIKIKENKPCQRIVLYYHDIVFNGTNAANATSIKIANATSLGKFGLGKMVVFDDPLTEDGNLLSPAVARNQGFYLYEEKNGFSAMFANTLIFNSTKYKGTINVIGSDPIFEETRDLSVVGGTGDFFMARGIVTLQTDAIEELAYFRLKMDIKLYECYNK